MEDTEAMLAQLFCQSDVTAQQLIVGAQNSVDDRMATAMDPIDLFIEAIKMDVLPLGLQLELETTEVGALLSVAMSHSGKFVHVPEHRSYSDGMKQLLQRLAQTRRPALGYGIQHWLDAAIYEPGHAQGKQRLHVGVISGALRTILTNHGLPSTARV